VMSKRPLYVGVPGSYPVGPPFIPVPAKCLPTIPHSSYFVIYGAISLYHKSFKTHGTDYFRKMSRD